MRQVEFVPDFEGHFQPPFVGLRGESRLHHWVLVASSAFLPIETALANHDEIVKHAISIETMSDKTVEPELNLGRPEHYRLDSELASETALRQP
ncbi:MAG: hypothetical protein OXF94_11815 [Gammaproteobacteria bacterium]|nr:hypothetical protein [Gammaproteobacteria bacterium]